MKLTFKPYIILGTVFIISFLTAWLLPVQEIFKGIFAVPGSLALLGVIYQLIRDSAQFERSMFMQKDQQIFNLGATSHMATVAFDKHVEFCEKYMAEVHETVDTLFKEGPSKTALNHSAALFTIGREYSAWIPKKIALQLEPFENAIHRIGTTSGLVEDLPNSSKDKPKAISESYAELKKVLELDDIETGDPDKKNLIAKENIKEKIRSILGINELTEIRLFIIKKSIDFINKNT